MSMVSVAAVVSLASLTVPGWLASAGAVTTGPQAPAFVRADASCSGCTSVSYWGARLGGSAPYSWAPVAGFENMVSKQMSLVSFGLPFDNCAARKCSFYQLPTSLMTSISSRGGIPFIDWASSSLSGKIDEPQFSLSKIASGGYDGYIRQVAQAAKQFGKPFFLRFDWEMNGNWSPWGQPEHGVAVNGNTPAEFVRMWRHVHRLFTLAGASNVRWVWCPNIDPTHYWTNMASLYPGNGYVDWTCLDGYNWGTTGPQRGGWQSFNTLFSWSYNEIVGKIAPTKPMILGEVASSQHGGSEAAWITNMFQLLATRYTDVHGFLWYDLANSWTSPLRPSSAATRAFAAGLQSNTWLGDVSTCVTGDTIPTVFAARAASRCGL